ncbi:hypothetical protein [Aliiglaciecola sp. M165]|uniref:hypothetical protein n=1 Tax=Aliiglaciecola sp. M165 TaxID=2593649 RepID=UPI00117CED70|nr:hypothetical protein [Aliiglaciecola sp. M165]TRY29765.1 hypothetical protein FM019_16465 [Aliiglaciecola sp. M165]
MPLSMAIWVIVLIVLFLTVVLKRKDIFSKIDHSKNDAQYPEVAAHRRDDSFVASSSEEYSSWIDRRGY